MTFSETQCKAARALLGWSQSDLAKKASVAVSTVADFERRQRKPVAGSLGAMYTAFEVEGIHFTESGVVIGPKSNFTLSSNVPDAELNPVRWINESDLHSWSDRLVARQQLPELIRRILLIKFGYGGKVQFPSGDSSQLHGWDGLTNIRSEDALIPSNQAAWEMSVINKKKLKKKASEDYQKRSANPGAVDPSETTFVFVTPRVWAKKDEWESERRKEGIWRDIRVIDGNDLARLLEQTPAVAMWLASQVNLMPGGVRLLSDAWDEWSLSTAPPLSESLILSERDEEAAKVHQWINGPASSIAVQAESTSEAIAFLHASVSNYPQNRKDAIESRILVAESESMAREIIKVRTPVYFVVGDADPSFAALLVSKGHHVYLAYGSKIDGSAPINTISLSRPNRFAIAEELKALKVADDKAEQLAHNSGRSLTVLRRLMEPSFQQPPTWAQPETGRSLLPMLMAGACDNRNEFDQAVLSEMSDISFEELQRTLTITLKQTEPPLCKVGSIWKIASPLDAWFRLSSLLSDAEIDKFKKIALRVLSSPDPQHVNEENDYWFSFEDDESKSHSKYLRQGIVETIILIGVYGEQCQQIEHLQHVSDYIVKELLHNADAEKWKSLRDHLRGLAEASPDVFLKAVNASLEKDPPPIMSLFEESDGDVFGYVNHVDLLWALEMLSWSPDYLKQSTEALLKLDEMYHPQGNWENRPDNSLRQIYLLWHPQTYVSQCDRLKILNGLRKDHPDAIWKLVLSLYPKAKKDHASNNPKPQWRSFDESEKRNMITKQSISEAVSIFEEWLLEDVGTDANRWADIVNQLIDLAPELRIKLANKALNISGELCKEPNLEHLRRVLRELIHMHREFVDADWVISEDEIANWERIYRSLEGEDIFSQHGWLFENPYPFLEGKGNSLRKTRGQAMEEIFNLHGVSGIRQLVKTGGKERRLVGQSVVDALEASNLYEIMDDLQKEGDDRALNVLYEMIATLGSNKSASWSSRILEHAQDVKWSDKAVGFILPALPQTKKLRDEIKQLSNLTQDYYWRHVSPYDFDKNIDDVSWIIEGLIDHGRVFDAMEFLVAKKAKVDSLQAVQILESILSIKDQLRQKYRNRFQYCVEQIFLLLDKDESFDAEKLGNLEWKYLDVLNRYRSSRPPRVLHERLAADPHFFSKVISLAFRVSGESSVESLDDRESENQETTIYNVCAYDLLSSWHLIPGTKDGFVCDKELKKWVQKSRKLCGKLGLRKDADKQIGRVLAHAPKELDDGTWPCVSVRNLIERVKSEHIENGFYSSCFDKRGVINRGVFDGGELERQEADYYRKQTEYLRIEWPRTAGLLKRIVCSYENHAEIQDQDVERLQW